MIFRFITLCMAIWPLLAMADADPAQAPVSGMILKYETPSGGMLTADLIDWSGYTKVRLDRATVEFREGWVSDQQRLHNNIIREADQERIKTMMSDLLDTVLRQELAEQDGLTLAEESGADVLQFTPRIVKLDIIQPGRAQDFVGHVLIDAQGSMVIVLDISDSISGKLLASSWQLQVDYGSGYMESTATGRNKVVFRQMLKHWAGWFFELFDHVKAEAVARD